MQIEKIIDVAITVVGPVMMAYSIVALFRTHQFVRSSAEAEGEVVRLERRRSGGRVVTWEYVPVFRFAAADGKTYTVTSGVGSSPPSFDEGEQVSVLYDPANPSDARIHTLFQIWGTAVAACTVWGWFSSVSASRS